MHDATGYGAHASARSAGLGPSKRGRGAPSQPAGCTRRAGSPHAGRSTVVRAATCLLLLAAGSAARAALLPTEIYYNGPLAGADADEFLEITNASDDAIALADFFFSAGISYTFPVVTLPAGASLVLAPNAAGFTNRFADFAGTFFDVGGGLSNAGETITLLDATGSTVFSLTYDDSGAWPAEADGGGASLELAAPGLPLSDPDSWLAAAPDPGTWRYLPAGLTGDEPRDGAAAVPAPHGLALIAMGLLGLGCFRHRVTTTASLDRGGTKL